jgi:PII-like signaling protein
VDEDCIVLTSYLSEPQHAQGVTSGEALLDFYGRRPTATSILLRGIEGFGRQQPRVGRSLPPAAERTQTAIAVATRPNVQAVLDETLRLARSRLVTMERARLLSGEIDPVWLGEEPGEATRLTLYCRQRDRAYQIPAFEAVCELLYRREIAGATVVAGSDGVGAAHGRLQHAQFFRRDADVPLMLIAVGAGKRIALVLPELGGMFRRPLMTVEKIRLCKRDGQFVSHPRSAPGTADADAEPGMTAQLKLTVYTSEAAQHDGQPVHRAIVRSLSSVGVTEVTTVRGIWGYHGDHAPHGDHFPRSAHHVPVVTTVIGAPEGISAAFDAIDPLTAERGLVTVETVLAARPAADAPSRALASASPPRTASPPLRRSASAPPRRHPGESQRGVHDSGLGQCANRARATLVAVSVRRSRMASKAHRSASASPPRSAADARPATAASAAEAAASGRERVPS